MRGSKLSRLLIGLMAKDTMAGRVATKMNDRSNALKSKKHANNRNVGALTFAVTYVAAVVGLFTTESFFVLRPSVLVC